MNSRVRLLAQFRAFHRLLIPENVIKNMGKKSIFQASPLQNSLIPLVHSHQNVVLKTQTGAGKSFSLVLGAFISLSTVPFDCLCLSIINQARILL